MEAQCGLEYSKLLKMDWKNKLTDLSTGDKVRVLRPGCIHNDKSCCTNNGYLTSVCIVQGTIQDGRYKVENPSGSHCNFPRDWKAYYNRTTNHIDGGSIRLGNVSQRRPF